VRVKDWTNDGGDGDEGRGEEDGHRCRAPPSHGDRQMSWCTNSVTRRKIRHRGGRKAPWQRIRARQRLGDVEREWEWRQSEGQSGEEIGRRSMIWEAEYSGTIPSLGGEKMYS
jgi:hypothetical protein